MAKKSKKNKAASGVIADNRKARFDYHVEQTMEAGLVLLGWEVKSLRAGHAQLKESYVVFKEQEAFLIGAHITPLKTASAHTNPDARRTRKLLLSRKELDKLQAGVHRLGYTVVPLNLHFRRQRIKLEIALVKGKKQHDKRAVIKEREWSKDKARLKKNLSQAR